MNKLPKIDEEELPLVPCMVHPEACETLDFKITMVQGLQAISDQLPVLWAMQTIAALQELWIESTNKLFEIEAIIRGDGKKI